MCIHDGALLADPARPRRYTPQQYLRSPTEMRALFADIPEALRQHACEIARRCSLRSSSARRGCPTIRCPAGARRHEFLRAEAQRGLERASRSSLGERR